MSTKKKINTIHRNKEITIKQNCDPSFVSQSEKSRRYQQQVVLNIGLSMLCLCQNILNFRLEIKVIAN